MIFFTGPLTGILINRLGCRVTSLAGGLSCASSLVLSSFSNHIVVMYFSYSVLYGLGTSLALASSLVITAKYFEKRRAFATRIVVSGTSLGIMCLGPVLQSLLDAFGWRNTYRVMAGVVFVICLLGCFYNPNVENGLNNANLKEEKERPAKDTRGSPTVKKEMKKRRLVDTGVWKNQSFV